jgi:hypothetical protein
MWGTYSPDQRPTDLGARDAGFDFRGTDIVRQSLWSGTAWESPDPTTTKGDLLARSATEIDRLPVGPDTDILTADSSQPLGVKWAPANSSGVGAVSSVFGRSGAVAAASGDYNASQVTNAVSQAVSYADPAWIGSLAYSKITGAPVFLTSLTPWTSNINGATFNLTNAGSIGIGVTSPLYKLDVRTPGSAAAQVHIASTNTDAGGYIESRADGNIDIVGGSAYDGTNWIAKSTTACMIALNLGNLIFYNASGLTVGGTVTFSERLRISTTGQLGIGTASPGCALDIANGSMRITANSAVTAATGMVLDCAPAAGNGRILCYGPNATTFGGFQIFLSHSDGSGTFTPFNINSGGNLGLGAGVSQTHLLELVADSAAKPTTNTWTITSDIRTKRNVKLFEGGMEIIRILQPIVSEYNGKAGTPEGGRVVSLDPAKLRELVPHAVSSTRMKLTADDAEETDVLGVNTHELFYHMLVAIQQIERRIAQLEPQKT